MGKCEKFGKPIATPSIEAPPVTKKIAKLVTASREQTVKKPLEIPIVTSTEKVAKPVTASSEQAIDKPLANPIATSTEQVTDSHTVPSTTAKSVETLAKNVLAEVSHASQEPPAEPEKPIAKPRKTVPVPKAVGEENTNACQRYFDRLNEQQQQDVLTVFFQQLKVGTIKNKASYFIGLTKKSQQGALTLPTVNTTQNKPDPQSPEGFAIAKAADKERNKRATLWSHYQWLKQQAINQNRTEQELAISMNMEDAYALFSGLEQEQTVDYVV